MWLFPTQHRADSAKLLTLIGLDAIQEEDLEEEVFKVLLEKLHAEPFLVRLNGFLILAVL